MLMIFETATLKQPSSAVARLWLGWAGLGAHQTSGKKCPWPPLSILGRPAVVIASPIGSDHRVPDVLPFLQ